MIPTSTSRSTDPSGRRQPDDQRRNDHLQCDTRAVQPQRCAGSEHGIGFDDAPRNLTGSRVVAGRTGEVSGLPRAQRENPNRPRWCSVEMFSNHPSNCPQSLRQRTVWVAVRLMHCCQLRATKRRYLAPTDSRRLTPSRGQTRRTTASHENVLDSHAASDGCISVTTPAEPKPPPVTEQRIPQRSPNRDAGIRPFASLQTAYSNPQGHATAFISLPNDPDALSAIARNDIVHYRASGHGLPHTSRNDINALWLEAILDTDQSRHREPLHAPRSSIERVQRCCRDHTLFCVGAFANPRHPSALTGRIRWILRGRLAPRPRPSDARVKSKDFAIFL